MEWVGFGGWECLRIVSGDVEILMPRDIGPRIIRLGFIDGPNELYVKDSELGLRGGADYRGYGGHRLWIAPEDPVKTYTPENDPVDIVEESDGWFFISGRPDQFGVQKAIRIRAGRKPRSFELEHLIRNAGADTLELAPWCLTVMAPGGVCFVPQEPELPHGPANLLPARPIAIWSYTDMSDERYTWGKKLIRLRHADAPPTKFGALVKAGWAAYANRGHLFVKQFEFLPDENYPDYQSNFEAFTRHDMLEVETLGPIRSLSPGQSLHHRETWSLNSVGSAPDNDDECLRWIAPYLD